MPVPVLDPSLRRSAYGSCLIIGKSGSGKSTLVLSILKALFKLRRHRYLFTLNVKSKEYLRQFPDLCTASYDSLDRIPKHAVVVVEDLIELTHRHSVLLKQSLNYASHHRLQKFFVVTHHIFKNNVFNLLPYFNYIIFTSAQSNLPILDSVLKFFKVDKETISGWVQNFRDSTRAGGFQFFVFDCLSHELHIAKTQKALLAGTLSPFLRVDSRPDLTNTNILQERFNSLSLHHPLRDVGGAVFSILCQSIDCSLINSNDLTLKAFSKSTKSLVHCSLVDYVFSLVDKSARVTRQSVFLHHYFKNKCQIPRLFVQNAHLQ